jgi:hypothetical protein
MKQIFDWNRFYAVHSVDPLRRLKRYQSATAHLVQADEAQQPKSGGAKRASHKSPLFILFPVFLFLPPPQEALRLKFKVRPSERFDR